MAFWTDLLSGGWRMAKPFATDPLAWLSAIGTGAGVYDIYRRQRAEADYLRKQQDWMRRVESTANAPLNVEAIFNPAKALIQRDLEAGLAERGLQPGGAYASAMGEGMMKNWLNAADIASRQRAGQLQALTGMGPVRPEFPAVGDTSAIGKYLQYKRESQAAERARGQQASQYDKLLEILKGQQPPWWGGGTGRSQSINMYPDIPDDFSGGVSDAWYNQ